jgi:hypothetical protein
MNFRDSPQKGARNKMLSLSKETNRWRCFPLTARQSRRRRIRRPWVGEEADGISLISWASYLFTACLWFIYGVQKRDKTIYLACVGWIFLDAAVVAGVIVHG